MKTATIKFSSFDKSFSTPNGTFYAHNIELSNGDKGSINAKQESPAWLRAGQELSYDITPNGKYPDKIKRLNPTFVNPSMQVSSALEQRIKLLEKKYADLSEVVKQLVKHTKMAYVAPKEEPKPQFTANGNSTINPDEDSLPF